MCFGRTEAESYIGEELYKNGIRLTCFKSIRLESILLNFCEILEDRGEEILLVRSVK